MKIVRPNYYFSYRNEKLTVSVKNIHTTDKSIDTNLSTDDFGNDFSPVLTILILPIIVIPPSPYQIICLPQVIVTKTIHTTKTTYLIRIKQRDC